MVNQYLSTHQNTSLEHLKIKYPLVILSIPFLFVLLAMDDLWPPTTGCAVPTPNSSRDFYLPPQVTLSSGFKFALENPIPFICSMYFSANSLQSVTKFTPDVL